jgi:hypothetical protein
VSEFFIQVVVSHERALAAELTDEYLDEMWHPAALRHLRMHRVEDLSWSVAARCGMGTTQCLTCAGSSVSTNVIIGCMSSMAMSMNVDI